MKKEPEENGLTAGQDLSSADLLACPFCGNAEVGPASGIHLKRMEYTDQITCGRCGASGPLSGVRSAREVWNFRPANT